MFCIIANDLYKKNWVCWDMFHALFELNYGSNKWFNFSCPNNMFKQCMKHVFKVLETE